MWILGVVIVAAFIWYFGKSQQPHQRQRRGPAPQVVIDPPALPTSSAPPAKPEPKGPITTDRDAKAAFQLALEQRGFGRNSKQALLETVADFGREMKEHREELTSSIAMLKEEIENQTDYRNVIADELECMQEERNPDGSDDEFIAKKQRHLGHLDREMKEMTDKLAFDQASLKEFKTDRMHFVEAYLAHALDGLPTPNRARQ